MEVDAPISLAPVNISAPLTLGPVEVTAPLTTEETNVNAPLELTPLEISSAITFPEVNISAPISIPGANGGGWENGGTYQAAVALSGHKGVAFNSAGELIAADASSGIRAAGVIRDAVGVGESVKVYVAGPVNGFSGLTPNAPYWLGEDGSISPVAPSGGIVQALGVAASASVLLVEIGEPITT